MPCLFLTESPLGLQNCQVSDFPLLSPPMVLFWVTVPTLWFSDLISSL